MTRLKAVHTSQLAIIEDLRGDSTMYNELADMLQAGTIADNEGEAQQQRDTRELSESEQFRQSMISQVMSGILSSQEDSRRREQERQRIHQERRRQEQAEAEERERLYQARLEEIRAQSAEQTRIRLAQLKEQQDREDAAYRKSTQEFRDDFVAEKACIVRRIEKRKANKAWHTEWSNQLPLIIRRRANQSANAG